jgi:hypothetical protein
MGIMAQTAMKSAPRSEIGLATTSSKKSRSCAYRSPALSRDN